MLAIDTAIERGDYDHAHETLLKLRPAVGETRAWQELEGALAPDAYWRATTWRRLTAIFAGPAQANDLCYSAGVAGTIPGTHDSPRPCVYTNLPILCTTPSIGLLPTVEVHAEACVPV